ncbi:MAG: MarR family transcriptional regulator [Flavobacteriales bacterium]|nr:MarR family transcriptional regulator [Flavobacteriales bacterium]
MKIEDEIKQKKFASEFHKAQVNILFTSSWLGAQMMHILKPHGISSQQFNIMRILRGQYPNPAPLKLLTERMIDRMSNTSRLVEKLVQKKLVERKVCKDNRRQIDIVLTEKGMTLINLVSEDVDKYFKKVQIITNEEAKELNRILDKLRGE